MDQSDLLPFAVTGIPRIPRHDDPIFTLPRYDSLFVCAEAARTAPSTFCEVDRHLREDALRRTVFIKGINVNFIPQLLELLRTRPVVHAPGPVQRFISLDVLHAPSPIRVFNTGRRPINTLTHITVIPPLTESAVPPLTMALPKDYGTVGIYPLATVEKDPFQRQFNEMVRAVCTMGELEEKMGAPTDSADSPAYVEWMARKMFTLLAGNRLWVEMVNAVRGHMTSETQDKLFYEVRKHLRRYWYPYLGLGSKDNQGEEITSTRTMIDIARNALVDIGSKFDKGAATLLTDKSAANEETLNKLFEIKRKDQLLMRELFTHLSKYTPLDCGCVMSSATAVVPPGQLMDVLLPA